MNKKPHIMELSNNLRVYYGFVLLMYFYTYLAYPKDIWSVNQ